MSADKAIIHYFMEEEMLESTDLNKSQPAPTERAKERRLWRRKRIKMEHYPKEGHPPPHLQLAMV